ncbi:hypothetical protein [Glycomyces sp. NRRL B-16210]|uniref:hypothetical protein n=1 Tax=Glycomyces sp. NRRL B-16210 TaxID=1463821 RepID=UPI00105BE522|nr:hypothetical protein [Glycomyces sp. NRRL B-16210]
MLYSISWRIIMYTSSLSACKREFSKICKAQGTQNSEGNWTFSIDGTEISTEDLSRTLISKSVDQQTRDHAWRTIVNRTREQPNPWIVIAVGVALPGIYNAIRHAASYAPNFNDRTELESAAIAGFIGALNDIDIENPKVCARLCNRAYASARRCAIEISRYQRQLQSPTFESRPPVEKFGHPDLILAKAIRNEIVTPRTSSTSPDNTPRTPTGRRRGAIARTHRSGSAYPN